MGKPVLVPYMGSEEKPARHEISFIEKRGNMFYRDRFDALSIEDGFIRDRHKPAAIGIYGLDGLDDIAGLADSNAVSHCMGLDILEPNILAIIGLECLGNRS